MTPFPSTASAFSPWIGQPQAARSAESTSSLRYHPHRSLSDDDTARLPSLFGKAVVSSPPFMNARRNSFPDTRFLSHAIGGRSSKGPQEELYIEQSFIALRPIIQDHPRLSVEHHSHHHHQQQLPPIQHIAMEEEPPQIQYSPPLSWASHSSRSNSLSSWSPMSFDSSSRKGSIASLLNLDSDSRQPPSIDQRRDLPVVIATAPTRRGRPRAPKRKRNNVNYDEDDKNDDVEQKRRSMTKGLRHFSKLVSDKVAERGVTTYNQVADELAAEIRSNNKMASTAQNGFDQKNIRRRVYDALNVLMAMDIIAKDKKEIRWLGIPSCFHNSSGSGSNQGQKRQQQQQQQQQEIEEKIRKEEERYRRLTEQMQQARLAIAGRLNEYLRLRDLVSRNEKRRVTHEQLVRLPFSIVQCNQDDVLDVAPDGRQAVIVSTISDDNGISSVYSDFDILQGLGYGTQQSSYLPDPNWYSFLCPPHPSTVRVAAS